MFDIYTLCVKLILRNVYKLVLCDWGVPIIIFLNVNPLIIRTGIKLPSKMFVHLQGVSGFIYGLTPVMYVFRPTVFPYII